MNLTNFQDDFTRIRNTPDQYRPEVEHRELRQVKVGTWLFGLLPFYRYEFTQWEKDRHERTN